MEAFLIPAAAGFAGGAVRAIWGALKNKKKGQEFEWSRFGATLIEAGVAGAISGAVSLNPIAAFFVGAGATALADKLRKAKVLPENK